MGFSFSSLNPAPYIDTLHSNIIFKFQSTLQTQTLYSSQGTPCEPNPTEKTLFSLQGFPCKPLYFPVRYCSAVLVLPKIARSAQTHKSMSFIWIVWNSWCKPYSLCTQILLNSANLSFVTHVKLASHHFRICSCSSKKNRRANSGLSYDDVSEKIATFFKGVQQHRYSTSVLGFGCWFTIHVIFLKLRKKNNWS